MTVVIASLVVRPIAVVGPIVMVLRRVLLRLRVLVAGRLRPAPLGTRWMSLAGLAPLVALRPARRAVLGAVALAGFRRRGGLDRRRRHDRRRRGRASAEAWAWPSGRGLGVGRGFFVGAGVDAGVGSRVGRTTTPITGRRVGSGVASAGCWASARRSAWAPRWRMAGARPTPTAPRPWTAPGSSPGHRIRPRRVSAWTCRVRWSGSPVRAGSPGRWGAGRPRWGPWGCSGTRSRARPTRARG